MEFTIRKMIAADKNIVIDMMRGFYKAFTITSGSEEIFVADVDACLKNSPYLDGYVFVVDEKIIGYGMIAKSFATEFGGECIWIEDIFIDESFRGQGIGSKFIQYVKENYPQKILRLETEHDNVNAAMTYRKRGFKELPYLEMVYIK
ncbi:MAG: GNAT family N-acetyltransferase [Selenomonadaceae bacterium]|nr:GNAT family N-acetyltransferase [Selenomonadaceae bacterium]